MSDREKKVPWWQPQLGQEEQRLVLQVLDENFPNEGYYSSLFEQKIAKLVGAKYAIAATSGTAAMFLSLKALGIADGDEVIVPDMTFIATANAVDMCSATPVLVDIDPNTLTIDPKAFKKAITSKTKAVIPVHVTGRAADMKTILTVAEEYEIYVIEDAAEAFMSKYKGKHLGRFGKTGCFSFSPNKIITTGQGGIIVTDDDELHVRLRELKDQGRPVRGTGGDDIHHSRGYNFKFTNLQAALGLGQLTYLDERMKRLVKTHEIYADRLSELDGIEVLLFDTGEEELPLWTDVLIENREKFIDHLKSLAIDCRKFWHPIHTQKPYKLSNNNFPNSTHLASKALWLPSAYTLVEDDINYVCDGIKSYFNDS